LGETVAKTQRSPNASRARDRVEAERIVNDLATEDPLRDPGAESARNWGPQGLTRRAMLLMNPFAGKVGRYLVDFDLAGAI
jgi:hypothetical protein